MILNTSRRTEHNKASVMSSADCPLVVLLLILSSLVTEILVNNKY